MIKRMENIIDFYLWLPLVKFTVLPFYVFFSFYLFIVMVYTSFYSTHIPDNFITFKEFNKILNGENSNRFINEDTLVGTVFFHGVRDVVIQNQIKIELFLRSERRTHALTKRYILRRKNGNVKIYFRR